MESERLIKQVMTVYSEIMTRLVDDSFRFSKGGKTISIISKFLNELKKEYGEITKERIVDFCIHSAYSHRKTEKRNIIVLFGPLSRKKFRESKHGKKYYEDEWLSSVGLTRKYFYSLMADKKEHPQAKYIFVISEEITKKRHLNESVGWVVCQTSTLGWSPCSESCEQCKFVEQCKKETERKYPELYRIRVEYGQRND